MRFSFARAGGSSSTMTTRISVMRDQRQVDRDARAAALARRDVEAIAVSVKEIEAAPHILEPDAGREAALQSGAVVLDRAQEPVADGRDVHVDASATGRQPVRKRVLDERLQQEPRHAR